MTVAKDAQTSYGRDCNLWDALNARLIGEAAMIDSDPRLAIAMMKANHMQGECDKLLLQLLTWLILIHLVRERWRLEVVAAVAYKTVL